MTKAIWVALLTLPFLLQLENAQAQSTSRAYVFAHNEGLVASENVDQRSLWSWAEKKVKLPGDYVLGITAEDSALARVGRITEYCWLFDPWCDLFDPECDYDTATATNPDPFPDGYWACFTMDDSGGTIRRWEKSVAHHLLEGTLIYYKDGRPVWIGDFVAGRIEGLKIEYGNDYGNSMSIYKEGRLCRLLKWNADTIVEMAIPR